MLPANLDSGICGDMVEYTLINESGTEGGVVYIFQTTSRDLYVTFKMNCPFVMMGSPSAVSLGCELTLIMPWLSCAVLYHWHGIPK